MEEGRQRPVVTLAVLSIAGLSFALLQSLVAPALPDIQHTLNTSEGTVAWILTAYLLSASVATPIIGRLGDVHGKEKSLLVVLAILALGTLISALATSIGMMILGRIIQGAGGGIFPLAFGIIRDEFPAERVAGSIGLMSAILGVGGGLGIVLAGPIVDSLSYHWLFWLPLATVIALGRPHLLLRAGIADQGAGAGQLGRRRAALHGPRSAAARDQRGDRLGLGFGQDDQPDHGRARHPGCLGRGRTARAVSPRRHDGDALQAGLDHRSGGVPARRRDVLLVHRPAPVRRDPDELRVRLRRFGHRCRALHGAVDRGDAARRPARRARCRRGSAPACR